jgi:hypothetical protein
MVGPQLKQSKKVIYPIERRRGRVCRRNVAIAQGRPKKVEVIVVVWFLGRLWSANPLFLAFLVSLGHLLTFREEVGSWWGERKGERR